MAYKQSKHLFQGMSKDLSDDKQKGIYYIDAHNIRITAREDTTLLSVTNEKGNRILSFYPDIDESLEGEARQQAIIANTYSGGQYIGHAVLNDYLILFNKQSDGDTIWRLNMTTLKSKRLYLGNLNFSKNAPIETLVDYETEEVQKVYWTDGLNQPRVINITKDYLYSGDGVDSKFDFVPEVFPNGINPLSVKVEKLNGTEGIFAAGTLQYFISYYNKFAQESNIVWQSPLLYVSPSNRGGSPNEVIANSFMLTINTPVDTFDYIRIYSIQHTSTDTDLIAKRIVDLPIAENITYIDNGTSGETIVPSDLYYKGGVPTAIGTMTVKDQTLFLGNIKLNGNQKISEIVKEEIKNLINNNIQIINYSLEAAYPADDAEGKFYDYYNQLNENGQTQIIHRPISVNPNAVFPITHCIASYKYLETYRFGVQFQDRVGRWSEPVYLGDYQNTLAPMVAELNNTPYVYLPVAHLNIALSQESLNKLINDGYVNARPLVVLPKENERECVAQGVICPTVYNLGDRKTNSPYAQSSWFFRPYEGSSLEYGMGLPYKHNAIIQGKTSKIAEIEKSPELQIPPTIGSTYYDPDHPDWGIPNIENTIYANKDLSDKNFFIDQSIITLNSPDIEFTDIFTDSNYGFRIVGMIDVTGFIGSMQLQASNAPNSFYRTDDFGSPTEHVGYGEPKRKEIASGYLNTNIKQYNISSAGYGIMGAGGYWHDTPYTEWVTMNSSSTTESSDYIYPSGLRYHFRVFPWQSTGSMNNTSNKTYFETDDTYWTIDTNTGELKYKVLANLRFSSHTKYLVTDTNNLTYDITDAQVVDPNVNDTIQLQSSIGKRTYYCNVDKLLPAPENTVREMLSQLTSTGYAIPNDPVFKKIYDWDIILDSTDSSTSSDYPEIYSALVGGTALKNHMALHIKHGGGLMRYDAGSNPPDTQIHNNAILSTKATATSITYKSNRHAVINLSDYSEHTYTILPRIKFRYGNTERVVGDLSNKNWTYGVGAYNEATQLYNEPGNPYIWGENYDNTAAQKLITITDDDDFKDKGILLLGELYRKTITNKYGGTSENAIEQNVWIPAGEEISLSNLNNLVWKEGDTYFQRYDCLKTYPYSNESENNIVEILSFMCETRQNIAGRYDKNRDLIDNTMMTNENFNLINSAYTQRDNFNSYRILDDRFDASQFKTQLTWTKTKSAGALIDNWTNITLANTLDLDGDKGDLVSLNRYKNDIIAFQPKGISQIIYNPNVQINTESGLPIEIANSGKVQGKRYLYEGIGCQNKWSICDEVYGSLYFVDNSAKGIYKLSDQGLISLTDTKGFRAWMENTNTDTEWKPYPITTRVGNFRTFYDKTYKDVYFVNNKTCLVYSDLLDQFVSFMDYQETNGMVNIGDSFYAISPLFNGSIWQQFAGEYNNIYNEYKNYDITFIDNAIPEMNKIYTNLEYRSDTYIDEQLKSDQTFDTVRVYNEYQDTGEHPINTVLDKPYLSDLQKKFRVWRIQLPRDKANPLNRINNTWTKITLGKTKAKNEKTVLHDAIVGYYI